MRMSDVIDYFGSKAKVAKALQMTPPGVTQWGEVVPELRQYEIEVKTRGALVSDWTRENGKPSKRRKAVAGE